MLNLKKIIKDSLILFAITLVAGLLLSVVNEMTKQPIAEAKERQKEEAFKTVFENASSFKLLNDINTGNYSPNPKITISEVYGANDDSGNILGYVFIMNTKEGYGGNISFAMGVNIERSLNGISILSSSETVGLGLEAENVLVPQFKNKSVEQFTYTKTGSTSESEIDAISSATITTNAFVNAVNEGLKYYDAVFAN